VTVEILRLSAFPHEGKGGNPAGVVLEAQHIDESTMRDIAAQVGYSETIFVTSLVGPRMRVRYFSPELEVDFCGHATIAAGVALGQVYGSGNYIFETNTGDVDVTVSSRAESFDAELTSTTGWVSPLPDVDLHNLLTAFGWSTSSLSAEYKPHVSNAGNSHPVLVLESVETLEALDYDFEALKSICRANTWPTVQLVARESETVWQSRNPFPFGGVYEDPATGSAAVAFGVYLRETGKIAPGQTFSIKQGFSMGQPCLLTVSVGLDNCSVSGTAVMIDDGVAQTY
jgi:PhzF family phenazine biosynthesis protein